MDCKRISKESSQYCHRRHFLDVGLNEQFGLQGVNIYAPRNLRKLVYQNAQDGTVLYNSPDLALDNGVENLLLRITLQLLDGRMMEIQFMNFWISQKEWWCCNPDEVWL